MSKMSTFIIDEEIDKVVDKFAEQLKARIKKLVERGEKIILKQYIASQKETARAAKTSSSLTSRESMASTKVTQKKAPARKPPRRESEYAVSSDDSFSDSD